MSTFVRATVFTIVATFAIHTRAAITSSGDTTIGSTITVGNNSIGTYRVDAGSTASSSSMVVGSQTNGVGFVTVTGAGSMFSTTSSSGILVGSSGIGRFEILNGAIVSTSSSGQFRIADLSSSQGTVIVDGSGSLLQIGGNLSVGSSSFPGDAILQISNGGIVNTSSSFQVTLTGHVELDNGLFRLYNLANGGLISGNGEVMATSTSSNSNGVRIEAYSGDLLRFTGGSDTLTNTGTITADGGEIQFTRPINNSANSNGGEIVLRNGVLRVGLNSTSTSLTNASRFASIGGESDLYGRITNTGSIAVTNHSVLIFHDDVTANAGTMTVFPGSSAIFLEDLTVNSGAVLQANLAGTNQNTGFGTIEVAGVAQLSGAVGASLEPGYTPQAGDTFPLIAASTITGSLTLGSMPALSSGLKWDLDVIGNRLLLSVVPGLAGDYNSDGTVDAADFVVWRDSVNQTGLDLPADGDGDGIVNNADYAYWRARFGNSIGSGASASVAVPEPGAIVMLFAAMALVFCGGRKLK